MVKPRRSNMAGHTRVRNKWRVATPAADETRMSGTSFEKFLRNGGRRRPWRLRPEDITDQIDIGLRLILGKKRQRAGRTPGRFAHAGALVVAPAFWSAAALRRFRPARPNKPMLIETAIVTMESGNSSPRGGERSTRHWLVTLLRLVFNTAALGKGYPHARVFWG